MRRDGLVSKLAQDSRSSQRYCFRFPPLSFAGRTCRPARCRQNRRRAAPIPRASWR